MLSFENINRLMVEKNTKKKMLENLSKIMRQINYPLWLSLLTPTVFGYYFLLFRSVSIMKETADLAEEKKSAEDYLFYFIIFFSLFFFFMASTNPN